YLVGADRRQQSRSPAVLRSREGWRSAVVARRLGAGIYLATRRSFVRGRLPQRGHRDSVSRTVDGARRVAAMVAGRRRRRVRAYGGRRRTAARSAAAISPAVGNRRRRSHERFGTNRLAQRERIARFATRHQRT